MRLEQSKSGPSNSFNCDVTSIFDLWVFRLFGFDGSSASRLCCNSTLLVGFLVRPDCQRAGEGHRVGSSG